VPDMRFQHYDAQAARAQRETVALIHRDAYADALSSGDPFESHEAFMRRFDAHARYPLLDLVIAYSGAEPVGQTWGFPVAKPTIAEPPADLTEADEPSESAHDDGEQIFALAEIMVRKAWTGRGIAHALHNELLATRAERCAELYVRPDNTTAYRAYLKWGWRRVGETRPDMPDAPLFDVLILPLPIA
jgi:ribosomal protein S18 acetylase RimI-like enzyme